jgi:acyl-CoA synthetase (NDP forming)
MTEWYGALSGGRSTVVLAPGRVKEDLEIAAATLPAFALLFRPSRRFHEAPLDILVTSRMLEGLARVCQDVSEPSSDDRPECLLAELEINPVVWVGETFVALDGKGRLEPVPEVRRQRPLEKISRLLKPRSAVVAGASSSGTNPGRIILRNLKLSDGISYGHLYALHPTEKQIDGIPCFARAEDLPEDVDLAVVAIPAEGAVRTIEGLCQSGKAASIILIPGGFAEVGRRDLEERIRAALDASRDRADRGPVLVGGNCLGIVSKHQYNTFFLPQYKLPFSDAPGESLVAVSQSGAYLVSLTSNLDGIIFPRASISYGNQVDLTVSDLLEHFEDEEGVRVIACYIEGFQPGDGARFCAAVRRLREKGRRVIVFKAGKTALGAKAAQSHTASLAGDYAVARALMSEAGATVAETLDMFEDLTKIATMLGERVPMGRRLAVISNAGFECSSVLDRLYSLELAKLCPETLLRLKSCLPAIAHADNPIDATPMATTAHFIAATEALLDDPGVDAVLVSPIPVTPALDDLAPSLLGGHSENIFSPGSLPQELARVFRRTNKPLVVNVDSGRLYDEFVMVLQRAGIPVYRKIDRASRALSAFCSM